MSSTTAPCREAWEGVLLDMGAAGRGWTVQQARSKWKAVKAAFHRERAHRHTSGQPSSQPPPQYRKLMRMWVRAGRPEYGDRRYTPAMIRTARRRQRRAVVAEEEAEEEEEAQQEEEVELEEEAQQEEEEAELEEEAQQEEEEVQEEEVEGPQKELEASGLELQGPQHQEEEFHRQEEVLVLDSEEDSELGIVETMDQLPSRAPLGLPLPSPGPSVPASGQLPTTGDRQVQTSPGLDLEEGELAPSPEPGCWQEAQQQQQQHQAEVAALRQQLRRQDLTIAAQDQTIAALQLALHAQWESNWQLRGEIARLLLQLRN